MPSMGRSHSFHSPQKEPFSPGGISRQKTFGGGSNRKIKQNAENLPPNTLNARLFGNESPCKSSSKKCNGSVTGSPGLPPRPQRKLSWENQNQSNSQETSDAASADNGVKVVVRVRPFSKKEEQEEAVRIVSLTATDSLTVLEQQYTFDAVASEESSQDAMFELVGLPMVENCLAGFNSSIFAYGQTGSGKTYTMWGVNHDPGKEPSKERGLAPRVFENIFSRIKEEESKNVEKQLHYQCRCSFLEIYNEQITDLLDTRHKNLQIREDVKSGLYVDNLTEEYVSNMNDVARLLLKGLSNRRIGATSVNAESSRSHTVFTCILECSFKSVSDGMSSVRSSRVNMVDLAGSERQKQSGAAGERLKEAGNINRSLSQLGNVINILAEVAQSGKQRHIPYRDSRLTFLLQESLGGNAKLAMICTVSPANSCRSETTSTLRFAQRAKAVQNRAVVNEETTTDTTILREQIRQLKDELKRMKSKEEGGGDGAYSSGWNARRSYNLLRRSLALPMTLPHDDDTDEEMEIDEDAVEDASKEEMEYSKEEGESTTTSGMEIVALEEESKNIPELIPSLESPTPTTSPRSSRVGGLQNSSLNNWAVRSTVRCSSSDRIAASLHRGLEILDQNHQQNQNLVGASFCFNRNEDEWRRKVEEAEEAMESYKRLAEKREIELEKERRHSEELREALELATKLSDSDSSSSCRSLVRISSQHHQNQNLQQQQQSTLALATIPEISAVDGEEMEGEDWMAWEEREREWKREKRLAERRRNEVEELKEALTVAMSGHARLLEQYAELQEKHMVLVGKQRRIREGVSDVRQQMMMSGNGESKQMIKWVESQAAQIVALNLEREQERNEAREEIRVLQSQLEDTAEAVQAAGELLVRLKEAEESVSIANDAAAMAEQEADALCREMEKMKRRHATEMATLQQRLLESRLRRSAACPMCVMAERVKFQFTEVDAATAEAALEAEQDAAEVAAAAAADVAATETATEIATAADAEEEECEWYDEDDNCNV